MCVAMAFHCHVKMSVLCPYTQRAGEARSDFPWEQAGVPLPEAGNSEDIKRMKDNRASEEL